MDKAAILDRLRGRLASVEQRLTAACARAGRQRSELTLVAVTKMISVETAALLPELGLLDLGENRPQELWRKAAALPKNVRWHLIGHLQRNKLAATLPLVELIHSVDSRRLLRALDLEAGKQQRKLEILLEVNAGGEAGKHGFTPPEIAELTPTLQALQHLRVGGLMTMAPLRPSDECRPVFVTVRRLRDELCERLPPPHEVRRLSMGMTNDFEVAVEEGATLVRLGSVLFEGLTS